MLWLFVFHQIFIQINIAKSDKKTLIKQHQIQNIKLFYYFIDLTVYYIQMHVWVTAPLLKVSHENVHMNASK